MAGKFFELDLDFLYGDVFDEETKPFAFAADHCPIEAALRPFKPIIEMLEPMLEPDVVPEASSSPVAPPSESAKPTLGSATTARVPSSSLVSPLELEILDSCIFSLFLTLLYTRRTLINESNFFLSIPSSTFEYFSCIGCSIPLMPICYLRASL